MWIYEQLNGKSENICFTGRVICTDPLTVYRGGTKYFVHPSNDIKLSNKDKVIVLNSSGKWFVIAKI